MLPTPRHIWGLGGGEQVVGGFSLGHGFWSWPSKRRQGDDDYLNRGCEEVFRLSRPLFPTVHQSGLWKLTESCGRRRRGWLKLKRKKCANDCDLRLTCGLTSFSVPSDLTPVRDGTITTAWVGTWEFTAIIKYVEIVRWAENECECLMSHDIWNNSAERRKYHSNFRACRRNCAETVLDAKRLIVG